MYITKKSATVSVCAKRSIKNVLINKVSWQTTSLSVTISDTCVPGGGNCVFRVAYYFELANE